MLNKKGVTLIEIIVSIALISIVMIYLFNLLVDIQYEEDHASYAKDNAVVRATIIKAVQDDFMEFGLSDVQLYSSNNISFIFKDGSIKTMQVTEDSISYDGETWQLESNNDEEKYDVANILIASTPENTCSYTLNVDSNADGVCDYNCDTNANGVLDDSERSTVNESFKSCSNYIYFHVVIPVSTSDTPNALDDIEFFYIGKKE